jgi:hypothetical protein
LKSMVEGKASLKLESNCEEAGGKRAIIFGRMNGH